MHELRNQSGSDDTPIAFHKSAVEYLGQLLKNSGNPAGAEGEEIARSLIESALRNKWADRLDSPYVNPLTKIGLEQLITEGNVDLSPENIVMEQRLRSGS